MFPCVVQGMKLTFFPQKNMMFFLCWENFGTQNCCRIPMRIWVWDFHMTLFWANRVLHDLKRWVCVFINDVAGFGESIFQFLLWVVIVCHNLFTIIGPDWNGVQETCFFCISVPGVSEYLQLEVYFFICVKAFPNFSSRKFTKSKVKSLCSYRSSLHLLEVFLVDLRCGGGQKESAVMEKDMNVFLETVKQHFQVSLAQWCFWFFYANTKEQVAHVC